MLTAAQKLLWAGDTTGCFVVHDPPPRTQSGPGLSGISATIELTLINGIGLHHLRRRPSRSPDGYSAWIQPSKSSRRTVSSRAGWSLAICSRITPTTSSSLSPRATNPHSHRISFAIVPPRLASNPAYCQDIGVTLAAVRGLRIQICGSLAVERDGQRLDTGLPGRQGRLLFTYLVVNRHRLVPRDELAAALWREPDPAAVDA